MVAQEVRIPDQTPIERLEAEITELAGHLAAAECRWLLLIAEYDRRAGYEAWGCRTCANWLSWHCGLDLRAAQERVRVARALDELPLITGEFAAGKLTYSKARALTRVATPDNETDLIMVAQHATATQVERAVRAYRGVQSAGDETEIANTQHRARFLRYDWTNDGSIEGNFRLPPEMAAIFLNGVAAAREQVPPAPDDERRPAEHPRDIATTNCDALLMMVEALLAAGTGAGTRGDRFQIVVNVDADVLAHDTAGMCELDLGPALAPETARRLACDASIVWMTRDSAGQRIPIGDKAPSIPAATRRAIRARDRCRFPGCGSRGFTQIHHVHHRAHGGSNEHTNLVELCWFHHRLCHEGGWKVRFDSRGEVLAIRPNGNVLPRPPEPHAHDPREVARANCRIGIPIDPATCVPRRYGDRFDLAEIVDGLIATERNPTAS